MDQGRPPKLDQISSLLKGWAVQEDLVDDADLFNTLFREVFTGTVSKGLISQGIKRSNWTYHSALAFLQTASIMDFQCDFESEGRMDGRVSTRDHATVLFAEWEWSIDSIFEAGAELDKLCDRAKKDQTSNCFLLSYCSVSDAPTYFARIATSWQRRVSDIQPTTPRLYAHLCLTENNQTRGIATALIGIADDREPIFVLFPMRGFAS